MCVCVCPATAGDTEETEGGPEQQGGDVQKVQSWRAARHSDKVLGDHQTIPGPGTGVYV